MGTVIMHSVVSVDGFIADENDQPGPLHEWYFGGDTPIGRDHASFDHSGVGSRFRVSRASARYVAEMWDSLGTIVMGRRLFDLVDGPTDRALVRDVEVGAGQPDHLVAGAGEHRHQVGTELSPCPCDQPARHVKAAFDLSGSHHCRFSRYHRTVSASPSSNDVSGW